MSIESMKQALEALEYWNYDCSLEEPSLSLAQVKAEDAITSLRVAIASYSQAIDAASQLTEAAVAEQHKKQEQGKPVAWDSIEELANNRYKVIPHASIFHGHAVVAGNGTLPTYIGREVECQNMARKFTGAFLDGAFAYKELVSTPQQRTWVGLTDEQIGKIWQDIDGSEGMLMRFARALEAAHGIHPSGFKGEA